LTLGKYGLKTATELIQAHRIVLSGIGHDACAATSHRNSEDVALNADSFCEGERAVAGRIDHVGLTVSRRTRAPL
jgi:hypothetical protein